MYLYMYINSYMYMWLTGCLCSDTVFDLSKRVLTEVETKILDKKS